MPIDSETGGKISYIQNKEAMCLSKKQAKLHLQKGRKGKMSLIPKRKYEIEQDIDRSDDNPYKKVVLNQVYKEEDITLQMESWSIFSDNVTYIKHDTQIRPQYFRLLTA